MPGYIGEDDLGVRLTPQGPADGRRDVGWIEGCAGDLVQHRLKEMVVMAIHHGDLTGAAASSRAAYMPPKPAPMMTTLGCCFAIQER